MRSLLMAVVVLVGACADDEPLSCADAAMEFGSKSCKLADPHESGLDLGLEGLTALCIDATTTCAAETEALRECMENSPAAGTPEVEYGCGCADELDAVMACDPDAGL